MPQFSRKLSHPLATKLCLGRWLETIKSWKGRHCSAWVKHLSHSISDHSLAWANQHKPLKLPNEGTKMFFLSRKLKSQGGPQRNFSTTTLWPLLSVVRPAPLPQLGGMSTSSLSSSFSPSGKCRASWCMCKQLALCPGRLSPVLTAACLIIKGSLSKPGSHLHYAGLCSPHCSLYCKGNKLRGEGEGRTQNHRIIGC